MALEFWTFGWEVSHQDQDSQGNSRSFIEEAALTKRGIKSTVVTSVRCVTALGAVGTRSCLGTFRELRVVRQSH